MNFKSIIFLFLLVFGAFLSNAKAVNYGYSYIDVDETINGKVYAETGTVLDYKTHVYYDPGIEGYMYKNNIQVAHQDRVMEYYYGDISIWIALDKESLKTYKQHGNHYVGSFYHSQRYGYYDPNGYSYFNGTYPSPYSFIQGSSTYSYYKIYKVASTEVEIQVPQPAPQISIDQPQGSPGYNFVTNFRGSGLFGTNQTVQVSGHGVNITIRPGNAPNDIQVMEINVEITPDADLGDHNVTLTVDGQVSNTVIFKVGDNSPVITNMTPPEGNTGDNVTVTISGSHFGLNPELLVDGTGVHATVLQGATTTQIQAVMSIADATYIGDRGVTVRSHGYSGNGFQSVPGNSDTSNAVPFEVIAASPKIDFHNIGSIEKGTVKTITVTIQNVPDNVETRFSFDNEIERQSTDSDHHWISGEARFDDGSESGLSAFSVMGSGDKQLNIRGWQRSSSKDNVDLKATFSNGDTKKKSLTISSVEFLEADECSGYDGVEFKITNHLQERYVYVPKGGSNTVKARVIPSGASGDFKFVSSDPTNFTVAPSTINSTGTQTITLTASPSAGRNMQITVKGNNSDTSNRYAEFINPKVLPRKEKKVVMYAVTEDNDDVKAIQVGQGDPNKRAYIILNGQNGVRDTVAVGDDVLGLTPYVERPPEQRNNPRLWRVLTGANGILETNLAGDDQMYIPGSASESFLYNPVPTIGNGTPNATCIKSGVNNFLDTVDRGGDDTEAVDPDNSALKVVTAGPNGRCQTDNNDHDISPPSLPSVTEVQNYLNDTTWGRQANIYFTVTRGQDFEVNFDLDRNKELKDEILPSDEAKAINNYRNDSDSFNLYYVGMQIQPRSPADPRATAYSYEPLKAGWFGKDGLAKQTVAHEIGHLLKAIHSPTGEDYQPDLMYPTFLPLINQCRVRNPDWSKVN